MEKNTSHVIIPMTILKEIDEIAGKRKRSSFLAQAAKERLKRLKLERALLQAAGTWKEKDHPEFARGSNAWVNKLRKEAEQRYARLSS